jgi:glycerol-3-phosphate dehydrogenase (NAD(P)+)
LTNLAIIGGGGWGTALACVLAPRFDRVNLWVREPDLARRIEHTRINDVFLNGVTIPASVRILTSLEAALDAADIVVSAMPSHAVRDLYTAMLPHLRPAVPIVSATKGLESGTMLRMSEVIRSVVSERTGRTVRCAQAEEDAFRIAVLSGPTFAIEVARGIPTALVVASADQSLVEEIQTRFSGPTFRVYGCSDPIGVEIGGALKNVIAIGAGIIDGLKLGHNAIAALITRGLAELTRLAAAAGALPETLSGLAGLGDLVLTCTGDLSRNRQVGLKLASGMQLDAILESTPTVAEGVTTTAVALKLAARYGVDLPIAAEMHAVLSEGRPPEVAIQRLMTRALRSESAVK